MGAPYSCWSGLIQPRKELLNPRVACPWLAGLLPLWQQHESGWACKWCWHSPWTHLQANLEAPAIHSFSRLSISTFCYASHSARSWGLWRSHRRMGCQRGQGRKAILMSLNLREQPAVVQGGEKFQHTQEVAKQSWWGEIPGSDSVCACVRACAHGCGELNK